MAIPAGRFEELILIAIRETSGRRLQVRAKELMKSQGKTTL